MDGPDANGNIDYPLMCFKYKDIEKSSLEVGQSVVTIRVDKLKPEQWWSFVDNLARGATIQNLKKVLTSHEEYHDLRNWNYGVLEVLYLVDTPMTMSFGSQIAVMLITIDGVIIPSNLVDPILRTILYNTYKSEQTYSVLDYYIYSGIPDMYMSTLVWSHNEFLASVLACCTLGSIILMVMVASLVAGVRAGEPEGSEEGDATEVNDGEVEEMDESETLIEETKLKGGSFSDNQSTCSAEGKKLKRCSISDNQSLCSKEGRNDLDLGPDSGFCGDITPDKAEVIVNKFNITATGEEEARIAEASANLSSDTSSNLDDQQEFKKQKKQKVRLTGEARGRQPEVRCNR